MDTVTSNDGPRIAFARLGDGPPVILVCGQSTDRSSNAPLAALLASDFTALNYDRRGRGDSGDTQPYAVEREVEDLDTLIGEAGGSAFVFGVSSGAALALEAAANGLAVDGLALWEPPFIEDEDLRPPRDLAERYERMIAEDRRGDGVEARRSHARRPGPHPRRSDPRRGPVGPGPRARRVLRGPNLATCGAARPWRRRLGAPTCPRRSRRGCRLSPRQRRPLRRPWGPGATGPSRRACARVLEGGPEMQQMFLTELRRRAQVLPADGSDEPADTAVAAELRAAYEEALSGIAFAVRTS